MYSVLAFLTALVTGVQAFAISHTSTDHKVGKNHCGPFGGNFTIDQYLLYPENADFDFNSCLLYIGLVVLIYLVIFNLRLSTHLLICVSIVVCGMQL
jgi:hypothetical protein